MTSTSLSTLAGAGLQAYGFAGRSSAESEQKLPLKGNDCECETENKKLAKNAALQTPTAPLISPSAVLALQAQDEVETNADGQAENGQPGAAGNGGENEQAASGAGQADAPLQNTNSSSQSDGSSESGGTQGDGLTDSEEKQVEKLKQRDQEVRAHEQAHARVGGAYAGGTSYSYQQGPDGKRYAIGGEVSIDTSSERTPEATARKMQVVIRAATAPAEPSSQDLKVAQQARAALAEAQAQIRTEATKKLQGEDDSGAAGQPTSPDGGQAKTSNGQSGDGPTDVESRDSQTQQASSAYRKAAEQAFAAAARESQGLFGDGIFA